jgi:hypothetical protein
MGQLVGPAEPVTVESAAMRASQQELPRALELLQATALELLEATAL